MGFYCGYFTLTYRFFTLAKAPFELIFGGGFIYVTHTLTSAQNL